MAGPPDLDERPVPRWEKAAAVVYVLIAALLLVVFRDRLRPDFWPLDASRVAPNVLATAIQVMLATPVAVLLWPPMRRRIHRFVTRHTAPLHEHLTALRDAGERRHAELVAAHAETQRHLRHVIDHSPNIPDLPPADPKESR